MTSRFVPADTTTFRRLTKIAFFLGLNIVLGSYFLLQANVSLPESVEKVARSLEWLSSEGASPSAILTRYREPDLESERLLEKLNALRIEHDIAPVELTAQLETVAARLLAEYAKTGYAVDSVELDTELKQYLEEAGYSYQWVSHQALVGPITAFGVDQTWRKYPQQLATVTNPEFTQVGFASTVIENGRTGVVVQLMAQPRQTGKTTGPTSSSNPRQPRSWPEVSDAEVIAALNAYRETHRVHPLNVHPSLCQYAEKRVQDLIAYGGLDNHDGFRKDFADQSNLPVGIREYPGGAIGENLAHQYCKNMTTGESFVAESGTALIEWCFDSSTKGHREAQLNAKFNNVCVRHGQGMYVVIFGE